MMRAREVRELLKGRVEPNTMKVLVALAEDVSVLRHTVTELAQCIDQMSNIIAANTMVQVSQKSAMELIKKQQGITKEDDERYGDTSE